MNKPAIQHLKQALNPANWLIFRVNNAVDTAKTLVESLQILAARKDLMIQIGQSVKYRPHHWTKIAWNSDLYADICTDIKDIVPSLGDDCDIFLDVSSRIILVRDEGRVLPILFLSRNGQAVVYRIVLGDTTLWLITIAQELAQIEFDKSWMGASEALPKPRREDYHSDGSFGQSALKPGWKVNNMQMTQTSESDEEEPYVQISDTLDPSPGGDPPTNTSSLYIFPSEVEAKEFSRTHCEPTTILTSIAEVDAKSSQATEDWIEAYRTKVDVKAAKAEEGFDYDRYPFPPGTAARAFSRDRVISTEEVAKYLSKEQMGIISAGSEHVSDVRKKSHFGEG